MGNVKKTINKTVPFTAFREQIQKNSHQEWSCCSRRSRNADGCDVSRFLGFLFEYDKSHRGSYISVDDPDVIVQVPYQSERNISEEITVQQQVSTRTISQFVRNEPYSEITEHRTEDVTAEWKEDMFSNQFANKLKEEITSVQRNN